MMFQTEKKIHLLQSKTVQYHGIIEDAFTLKEKWFDEVTKTRTITLSNEKH